MITVLFRNAWAKCCAPFSPIQFPWRFSDLSVYKNNNKIDRKSVNNKSQLLCCSLKHPPDILLLYLQFHFHWCQMWRVSMKVFDGWKNHVEITTVPNWFLILQLYVASLDFQIYFLSVSMWLVSAYNNYLRKVSMKNKNHFIISQSNRDSYRNTQVTFISF
jgi:hypothetical protein